MLDPSLDQARQRTRMARHQHAEGTLPLPSDLLAFVDAYAASEGMTRDEALAFIVQNWLVGHGLLEPEPEGEEG